MKTQSKPYPKISFLKLYKPVRYEFKMDFSGRLINEYIPRNEASIVEYECFPSYSSMQFAEITDMNGSVIVARFGMRSGSDFRIDSMNTSSNEILDLEIEKGSSYSINRSSMGNYYVRKVNRSRIIKTFPTTKETTTMTTTSTTTVTSKKVDFLFFIKNLKVQKSRRFNISQNWGSKKVDFSGYPKK